MYIKFFSYYFEYNCKFVHDVLYMDIHKYYTNIQFLYFKHNGNFKIFVFFL